MPTGPRVPRDILRAPASCWLLWGGSGPRLWVIGQWAGHLLKGWVPRYCFRLQVKGLGLRQKVKRHDLGRGRAEGCIRLLLGL